MSRSRGPAVGLLVAALAAGPAAGQQADLDTVRLRPGVTLIRGGSGGNVLVVAAGDGTVLVDTREPAAHDALVRLFGPAASRVRLVVNTHYHDDHLAGNALFAPGATVLAHASVPAEALKDTVIALLDWHRTPAARAALPTTTVAGDTAFAVGGVRLEVLHAPHAHTNGDLMVWLPAQNVLHAGDLVELGAYPFIDVWAGGTLDGAIGGVERVLALADDATFIVPGHGPPSTRTEVAAYYAMLVNVREAVREARAANRSLEETLALNLTAPYDGRFGSPAGGRRFVALAYLSLGGKP